MTFLDEVYFRDGKDAMELTGDLGTFVVTFRYMCGKKSYSQSVILRQGQSVVDVANLFERAFNKARRAIEKEEREE